MKSFSASMTGKCLHALAASFATYFLSLELIALTALLGKAAGMARADATILSAMLGFVYLCALLIYAFSRPRVVDTWMALSLCGLAAALGKQVLAATLA
jgi:hypothetical protein